MNEHEAYLRQARSDFQIVELLLAEDRAAVPGCHPLHYLQMATEKLAKAILIVSNVVGFDRYSHVAFSELPTFLSRRDFAARLGWKKFDQYQAFLRRSAPVFREIDELNPSVGPRVLGGGAKEGANAEYPWRARDRSGNVQWYAPSDHPFWLVREFRSGIVNAVLQFVASLLERFEGVFA
jgi:hypothetical protein